MTSENKKDNEGTILYFDPTSTNKNMKVSTIKLNKEFEEYTKKDEKWIKTSKGGNKRKSKSAKKARRSK